MGRDVQSLCNLEKGVNGRTAQAALDLAVVGPVQARQSAEDFLRQAFLHPAYADDFTDLCPIDPLTTPSALYDSRGAFIL